jgi:hypothetical protein
MESRIGGKIQRFNMLQICLKSRLILQAAGRDLNAIG